jgi:hypothetical protein
MCRAGRKDPRIRKGCPARKAEPSSRFQFQQVQFGVPHRSRVRTYIATAETQEARFAEQENLFSRYLPYAVVFGLTEKWARAFAGLANRADTSWYVGSRPFTYSAFASSIDGFSVSTAATIASTPSGSGSSGFGGGARPAAVEEGAGAVPGERPTVPSGGYHPARDHADGPVECQGSLGRGVHQERHRAHAARPPVPE